MTPEELEKLGEIVHDLMEHADLSNRRFDRLEGIVKENNERTASLVGAIRDLIDRIRTGKPALAPTASLSVQI